MTYLARNFIPFSLQSSTIRVPLSLESRREMRHIETFFCAKKSTKFHLNKKLNFNKSVSYVRLRVGRVNIFIKFSRYWYYLLADKYELSARLLLYTYVVYNRMRAVINIQRDMNRPDKETLRRVIRKMHRQNDCEKFIELASVFTGMLRKLNFHSVEFASDDPYHPFPLYMIHIHSVICEEEYLYILCYNGNLHILGTYERGHILIPLKEQLTLRELFCWTCRSWWDRLLTKSENELPI